MRDQRSDYYEYLACLMVGTQGGMTLREIFDNDARRHGPGSYRGRLSALWAQRFPASGGDLSTTWSGSFPEDELAVFRVAQSAGNAALADTFRDLAEVSRLTASAHDVLLSTLWSALVALVVLVSVVLAVPFFTVPHLQNVFSSASMLPSSGAAQRLFAFAGWVRLAWPLVAVGLTIVVVAVYWSLDHLTGPLRTMLDRVLFWRLYRHVHAIRFFSVLTVVLGENQQASIRLRSALGVLRSQASPWLDHHVRRMMQHIDEGQVGAQTFQTGLLDLESYGYLCDVALVRGLTVALLQVRQRLGQQVLRMVTRQALQLRWLLLVSCVAALLALVLWHYAAIDDLRRSLMLFQSGS